MAAPQQNPDTWLQLRRTFAAPREKVFRAWTDRQALEKWMCRDVPTHAANYTQLDVRTGGSYRMEVHDSAGGITHVGQGVYKLVKPPEKVVFTWAWKKTSSLGGEFSECPETLVTVEFFERGAHTEVVLTHQGFDSAKLRDAHRTGWTGCFDALEKVL